MKLTISNGNSTILELNGDCALFPQNPEERAIVFYMLTEALGTLAGVTQPKLDAKAAVKDEHSIATEQCRGDRNSGVVVHLGERRGNQALPPNSR